MRALLLAAGEGSRLRPLTENIPKPMIEIAGRPILEHTIALLASHGITELAVNLHHKPESVQAALGDGGRWGVSITYSYEPTLLGTAGAAVKLREMFTETFLVVYGDNLFRCNLSRLIALHQKRKTIATMGVYYRDDPTGAGIVEVDDGGRVRRFLEKPKPEEMFSRWVNAGLLMLEPSVFEFIPQRMPVDFSHDVLPALLTAGEPICAYAFGNGEQLWWIDTPKDLARVRELFARGEATLADASVP